MPSKYRFLIDVIAVLAIAFGMPALLGIMTLDSNSYQQEIQNEQISP